MVIKKYNRGNGKYTIGSQASINANTNGGSTTTTTTSSSADNYLWGNYNDGTSDIEETIFVNGSVYAMPKLYEDIEEDDIEEIEGNVSVYEKQLVQPFEDDEGGNIYAENLIKSFGDIKADNSVVSKEVYGKTIFVDYPEVKTDTSNKTNLLDLLKSHKKLTITDSKNNELGVFDNTTDKTITIKNYDDEISDLKVLVNNEVNNLSGSLAKLQKNKSVILATVELVRNSPYENQSYVAYASCYDGLIFKNYVVGEGCIDVKFSVDKTKISNIMSLFANATIGETFYNSDSDEEILNGTSSSKTCDGAYGGMWTHTRPVLSSDKETLVVRSRIWHKDKDGNETVDSNRGWSLNAITKMSFMIAGEPVLI